MKTFAHSASLAILLVCLTATAVVAQAPTGNWLGTIDTRAVKLRLGMEITTEPAGKLSIALISIDQGGARIPTNEPTFVEGRLTVPVPAIGGNFVGTLSDNGDEFVGKWSQGGIELDLKLARVDRLPTQLRPQEPKPPYPYDVEEVTFENPHSKQTLAGTLTIPKGPNPHPAIVLVSGSGPQDRDETVFGHKPFAVLADAITRRGVAVLRYDDRGVGQSTGDFAAATTKDFATDALAAVRYLAKRDEIDSDRIGLGGHSEGAMVAPMVAAKFPKEVAMLVLIAPPAINGEEIIISQGLAVEVKQMSEASAQALATLRRKAIDCALEAKTDADFEACLAETVDEYVAGLPSAAASDNLRKLLNQSLAGYRTPWFRYFLTFDPAKPLSMIKCPVLAVLGEKDLQVLPEANLPALRAALDTAPTDDVRIEVLSGLNHLLQTSKTGLPSEYASIEQTIDPDALEMIASWIASKSKLD